MGIEIDKFRALGASQLERVKPMELKIKTQRKARRISRSGVERKLLKLRHQAQCHRLERATHIAEKPKKRFQDRMLLVGVVAGIMADRIIALGGYCKQAIEQVDPQIFANAFLSLFG